MNGDPARAFRLFRPIWKRIERTTNFSSEEIDTRYYSFLPILFKVGKELGKPAELLGKVALAYGYMSVHNRTLVEAEAACTRALEMLDKVGSIGEEGMHRHLAMRQLRAHALQNMGKAGEALKELLEIDAVLRDGGHDWPDVGFDVADRLQIHYQRANHRYLSQFYGRQSWKSVVRSQDQKLRAAYLITQSIAHLFAGEKEATRRADTAHRLAVKVKVRRFEVYTHLTQLVVRALYARDDIGVLQEVYEEARALYRQAVLNAFGDSIMRLELLLGTLSLPCFRDPLERYVRARTYVEAGRENSVRFGNGLFDWAFNNLDAVVELAEGRMRDDDVRALFRTCLEILHRRDLTFLGAAEGVWPNAFAISNIVRYFGTFHESEAVSIIKTHVRTYSSEFLTDLKACVRIARDAADGKAIFWPRYSRFKMLRYPAVTGYYTPIF